MNMLRKALFLLIFCTIAYISDAQILWTPAKPVAGSTVTFQYTPPSTLFSKTDTIRCTAFIFGIYEDQKAICVGRTYMTVDVPLTRSDNGFEGKLVTDNLTRAVALHFTSGKIRFKKYDQSIKLESGKLDQHDSLGYCLPICNTEGKELDYTNFFLGEYMAWDVRNVLGFTNPGKAKEYLLRELELYPENASLVFSYLPYFVSEKDQAEMESLYKKELSSIFEKDSLSESDYRLAVNLAYTLKIKGLSAFLNKMMKEKFGNANGLTAYTSFWDLFDKETNLEKKYVLLKQLSGKFEKLDYESKNSLGYNSAVPLYSEFVFMQTVLTKGDSKQNEYYSGLVGYTTEKILVYPNILADNLSVMIDTMKNIPLAQKKGNEYIKTLKGSLDNLKQNRSYASAVNPYMSQAEIIQNIISTIVRLEQILAKTGFEKGEYKNALQLCNDARSYSAKLDEPYWDLAELNAIYCKVAEKTMKPAECKAEVEKVVATGKWTQDMTDILKRFYIAEKGSEKGFDEYVTNLKKPMMEDLKKIQAATIVTEPAPRFTLTNLEGKTVNLDDYKGKVVILDFWATWCGPCKASFPAMKKLQEAYTNNPNVKILFVNTFERFKTLDENIAKVKEFLASNGYPFYVLLDNKSKVSEAFKVSGIPTKIIIDKNGNIRYKIVGAETNTGKLLDEMSVMIESIK
jgi:thiol-disulfide isomerase/thioredoxin